VTELLVRLSAGSRDSLNELLPLIYRELRRLAARALRRERSGHTLQPTALVHEAYLRLIDQRDVTWQNRAHFFAVAAQAMRRILVDHARARERVKRGGPQQQVPLLEDHAVHQARSVDVLALDQALTRLDRIDPRQRQVVELRYFSGLSIEETAAAMDISPATVKREWTMARAWLHAELARTPHASS
jgi:RNA polymerase sigma-70 factor (ECF subfamily)